MTPDFLVMDWGGNDVRRIERDSMGRVMKIVHGDPAHLMLDSVMYRYDPRGPVDTIIRNTVAYPASVTLDTNIYVSALEFWRHRRPSHWNGSRRDDPYRCF